MMQTTLQPPCGLWTGTELVIVKLFLFPHSRNIFCQSSHVIREKTWWLHWRHVIKTENFPFRYFYLEKPMESHCQQGMVELFWLSENKLHNRRYLQRKKQLLRKPPQQQLSNLDPTIHLSHGSKSNDQFLVVLRFFHWRFNRERNNRLKKVKLNHCSAFLLFNWSLSHLQVIWECRSPHRSAVISLKPHY